MGVLFIVSAEKAAGKTAICAGLAVNFSNAGKKVGYLKPQAAAGADGDIAFMKRALGSADVVNAPDMIKGRDAVLVEAALGTKATDPLSKDAYGAVREMKAKCVAVETYSGTSPKFADIYKGFGDSFLGVIVNRAPAGQLKAVKEKLAAGFSSAGVKLLGVIPENRLLLAITVGELADVIKGKILNNADMSGELVENFMLGAMVVGSGVGYFERKPGKAAIIHYDRPDMQLAALETPTSCLVLTGGSQRPAYNVFQRAESRGIPIIVTGSGAADVVSSVEAALLGTRLNQDKKLPRLADIVRQNLDIKAIAG